ncbi:unnamed protein product [Gongylonema pulchrum]|uniref:MAM domain-containing protein n=1 Tax=Gongylonema pulchrum TaxID=637853 RepID=A0A183D2L7_9BILA|nr:unnamed protein product [Gongylonema pulchrum]
MSGPCQYDMPDVYVDFIQGGNNLEGLYIASANDSKASWNVLFSIVYSIVTPAVSGAGDEQNVVRNFMVLP